MYHFLCISFITDIFPSLCPFSSSSPFLNLSLKYVKVKQKQTDYILQVSEESAEEGKKEGKVAFLRGALHSSSIWLTGVLVTRAAALVSLLSLFVPSAKRRGRVCLRLWLWETAHGDTTAERHRLLIARAHHSRQLSFAQSESCHCLATPTPLPSEPSTDKNSNYARGKCIVHSSPPSSSLANFQSNPLVSLHCQLFEVIRSIADHRLLLLLTLTDKVCHLHQCMALKISDSLCPKSAQLSVRFSLNLQQHLLSSIASILN